jgi:exosortase
MNRSLRGPHFQFFLLLSFSALLFIRELILLLRFSFQNEHYSHIVLIPLVSAFLLYTERNNIFSEIRRDGRGAWFLAPAAAAYFAGSLLPALSRNDFLSLRLLSFVLLWLGIFLYSYGAQAFRRAAFPVVFLALIIPIPDILLGHIIGLLVAGSAQITTWLFDLSGIPVLRHGTVFMLSTQTIEVARECSGIRSSLALFITSLLASHLFLRSRWSMFLLAVAAVGIAILKNGIRIATLTILAIRVDSGFLTGRLHHEGGFVFFMIGLGILSSVLAGLRWMERRREGPPKAAA